MRAKNTYTVNSVVVMDKDFDFIKLLEMFTKSQIDVSGFSIKDDKDGKNKIIHLTWVLKIHDNSEWFVNKLKILR